MKIDSKDMLKKIGIVVGGIGLIFLVAFGVNFSGKNAQIELDRPGEMEYYESPMAPSFNASDSSSMGTRDTSASKMAMEENTTSFVENQEQKMIREGSLDMRVESIDTAIVEFQGVVEYFKGQVTSKNIRNSAQGIKSGSVTVKVPQENFYSAMTGLKEVDSVAIVLRETISGQDVTERYIDLETQLSNKQAEEQAFLRLLEREGDELADIISVTRELSRVRGEIERIEGQLRYLDSKTDMSTITVSLSEDKTVTIVDTWRPLQEIKDAVNDLLASLQEFLTSVIRFVIVFVPIGTLYLIVFGIVFFVGRKIYRKIFGK